MKRKAILFMFLVLSVFLLTGCMNDQDNYYEPDEYIEEDTEPDKPEPVISDAELDGGDVIHSAAIPELENRKIIYIASLMMNAPDPETIYNNVINNLDTYTAYIESANITSNKYVVKIRVLSENFTDFVEEIKTTGDVVSFTKTSDDVTNSYSTFEARKLALETQHTRILELISEAVDLADILILENERFDIETELNEIGASLANYDSLVDFSTINLTINKTTNEVIVLPRTTEPTATVLEVTKNTVELRVYNPSDSQVKIYVDLLQNGEFVRQYEADTYSDSIATFKIDELTSFKDYSFKIISVASDHRESLILTKYVTTEKTFLNKVTNTFDVSFDSLVKIFELTSLAIVAISPYALTIVIIYIPARLIHKKIRKVFPKPRRIRIIESKDNNE